MAFRLLCTLVSADFMTKEETTGHYVLSLKVLQLSRSALLSLDVRKITMPYMELLKNQYPHANVSMAVYYAGEILVVDRIESQSIPRADFVPGQKFPFHCTALGKILICELPDAELDALIIKKGLKSFTANTITDPQKLKEELVRVRTDHLARDREEHILKDNCNAAPVCNATGKIIAAISLSAFENNMSAQDMENTIPALQATANRISSLAGFHAE